MPTDDCVMLGFLVIVGIFDGIKLFQELIGTFLEFGYAGGRGVFWAQRSLLGLSQSVWCKQLVGGTVVYW